MVSIESVRDNLLDEASRILILMQEGDRRGAGFVNTEWAEEMYEAYQRVQEAVATLGRAKLAE